MAQVFEKYAKQNWRMQFFSFYKYKIIILIIGSSRKTNALFNLTNHQDDYNNAINKICL